MSDGLTTQERIDKEFEELDGLIPEWKEEAAPQGEPEPKQEVQPEPEPPKEDPQLAAIREEARKAEARYQSLQGMFNKQQEELNALKTKPVESAKPVINAEQNISDPDYDLLVEEYGEPAAKAMKNMTGKVLESAKSELETVKAELKQTQETTGKLQQSATQSAEERYFAELEKAVPDWKQINGGDGIPQDPKFTELLTQTVPFQDYTYNDLLQHHHSNGNVAKVAEIFKAVKAQQPAAETVKSANPLEQMLEPERTGKGTAPPMSTTKRTFTKEEVQKFDNDYMLYQSGRIQANPEKIEARWNEIQDAISEGRVR